ncbi:MAG TPA: hypothetical protein DCX54_06130, partial [Flavobacteriales bacterium]|nr:hypothetical protein [Flavobacteriales bacterium]
MIFSGMSIKKTVALFLTLILELSAFPQQTILDRFQANTVDSQVYLSWTIKKGSTCNGIKITRSADSLNFVEIGRIDGVCGDASSAVNYSFIDATPLLNRKNFYRLDLGDVGPSEIISIDVIS